MNATVTNNRPRNYPERFIYGGCNVYVKSKANDVVDDWFHNNSVFNLDFKCKTWTKLKSAANKLNIEALRTIFGNECDVTYSHTAGCSCGCSPGFKVRKLTSEHIPTYNNRDVWVTLDVDVTKLESDLKSFDTMLEREIAANNELAVLA